MQEDPKAGEVGVGAKGSRGFLTRSVENLAVWTGMLPKGGLLVDLPSEPGVLVEGLCLSILELACAEFERSARAI